MSQWPASTRFKYGPVLAQINVLHNARANKPFTPKTIQLGNLIPLQWA